MYPHQRIKRPKSLVMSNGQTRTYDTIYVVEIEFFLSCFLRVNTWHMVPSNILNKLETVFLQHFWLYMVSIILQNQLSYDYEDDPSNVSEKQFTKVFIDDNLLPKEQKAFEDDLHFGEQGTVFDFLC